MPVSSRAHAEIFEPARTGSAVDTVVEQILELIRTGRLASGQLLPGERRLASAMQVSRRTIREAIEILQDGGVLAVETGAGGGARVASIWIPEQLSPERELLGVEQVFSALEARRVIEPRIAQLAALRGRHEDFAAMLDTIELQRTHQRDWWQVTQGNVLFHRLLWRAAGNADLEAAMRSIYRKLSGPLYEILKEDQDHAAMNESIELHVETVRATMRGQLDEVEEVMDRHLQYLEHRCEVMYGRRRVAQVPRFLLGSAHDGLETPPHPR